MIVATFDLIFNLYCIAHVIRLSPVKFRDSLKEDVLFFFLLFNSSWNLVDVMLISISDLCSRIFVICVFDMKSEYYHFHVCIAMSNTFLNLLYLYIYMMVIAEIILNEHEYYDLY